MVSERSVDIVYKTILSRILENPIALTNLVRMYPPEDGLLRLKRWIHAILEEGERRVQGAGHTSG